MLGLDKFVIKIWYLYIILEEWKIFNYNLINDYNDDIGKSW